MLGLPLMEVLEGVRVRGTDRPQMRRGPVAQRDVGLPVRRVLRRGVRRGVGGATSQGTQGFTPGHTTVGHARILSPTTVE